MAGFASTSHLENSHRFLPPYSFENNKVQLLLRICRMALPC